MIIDIDGKKYVLEKLEKMIEEGLQPKENNDVSSLLSYGDKIWIIKIHHGQPIANLGNADRFVIEIVESTWSGSTREYQLIEDNKLFRTLTSAREKLGEMYKACFDVYMNN